MGYTSVLCDSTILRCGCEVRVWGEGVRCGYEDVRVWGAGMKYGYEEWGCKDVRCGMRMWGCEVRVWGMGWSEGVRREDTRVEGCKLETRLGKRKRWIRVGREERGEGLFTCASQHVPCGRWWGWRCQVCVVTWGHWWTEYLRRNRNTI